MANGFMPRVRGYKLCETSYEEIIMYCLERKQIYNFVIDSRLESRRIYASGVITGKRERVLISELD